MTDEITDYLQDDQEPAEIEAEEPAPEDAPEGDGLSEDSSLSELMDAVLSDDPAPVEVPEAPKPVAPGPPARTITIQRETFEVGTGPGQITQAVADEIERGRTYQSEVDTLRKDMNALKTATPEAPIEPEAPRAPQGSMIETDAELAAAIKAYEEDLGTDGTAAKMMQAMESALSRKYAPLVQEVVRQRDVISTFEQAQEASFEDRDRADVREAFIQGGGDESQVDAVWSHMQATLQQTAERSGRPIEEVRKDESCRFLAYNLAQRLIGEIGDGGDTDMDADNPAVASEQRIVSPSGKRPRPQISTRRKATPASSTTPIRTGYRSEVSPTDELFGNV